MYRIFKKLEDEEWLHVTTGNELKFAVQLVSALKAHWPGRYVIKPGGMVGSVLKRKDGDIWFVTPDQTVYEAIQKMAEKEVGALLVISANKLVGVVSERDYARKVILKEKSSKDTLVHEIMTSPVISVPADRTVDECMGVMAKSHIHHLPVMEGDSVIGVVSMNDLVKWTISEQDETIEHLHAYIG